ncbi:ribose transport system substrate-binding protein [Rhodococcus sp. 27YEA15]|uniref:ABC transporter substrate-binding protein n=1 Tax=Rhodococcus sp. 27YEA15 TaxID=3156259 RepID=UPI003C7CA987
MKKLLRSVVSVSAAATIAVTLAACGGESGDTAADGSTKLTIGFVPGIASDPFFKAMQVGAEEKARELDIKLLWQGAADEYSPQSQLPFVDAMLTQQVDGLILVPTDPNALQPSVTKAAAMKIPVVTVDTTVADESALTSFITGDNLDGGRQAARTMAEQIGGSGEVFILSGSPTATTNQLREQGFKDEIAQNFPGITVVGTEYANSQPAKATSALNTTLLKYPELKGVFAADGTSGTGAVASLRNSGKSGQIKLIGYDAYENQIDDLKAGVYTALVAQQPGAEAAAALGYVVDKIRGNNVDEIEKSLVLPNVVITADNLAEMTAHVYPAN